jgi:hypothetical protein
VSRAGYGAAGMSILAVGSSTDELHKIDGKWLIMRHEITLQTLAAITLVARHRQDAEADTDINEGRMTIGQVD